MASKKRTLDSFFQPTAPKKAKVEESKDPPSKHSTYPFAVAQFPPEIAEKLAFSPASEPEVIDKEPDLDLLYYKPYISSDISKEIFQFLRKSLFFYRVKYTIKRGGFSTEINTPRFTTVFGVDETSKFTKDGSLIDAQTGAPIPKDRYKCSPRPMPACLDALRVVTEGSTGQTFNFCLVNYYASGDDSISFHSDDETFLGADPAIASFSLGATRDFLLKHKPPGEGQPVVSGKTLKFQLAPGDMVLMRGSTQSNWLHSIPKRKSGDAGRGRINITFRKAVVKGGTDNYYHYNVNTGPVYKWCESSVAMKLWP